MLKRTIPLDLPGSHDEHGASNTVLGFWLYLMADCIIFASWFAVFAVMGHQFAGGPSGKDVFELPGVMLETAILLLKASSTAFATHLPDLPAQPLMVMDFAITCLLVRSGRPRIWFLFVRSWLCDTLLSDPASRRRPCASLILRHHQAG
jgi:heme/copper-type cytochrome/quinol oxidase subunit 3